MNEAAQQVARMPDELRELADATCNGTLSMAQRDRLEDIVGQDESARLAYLAYLDIHAQLSWEGRSGTIAETGAAADSAAMPAPDASAPAPRKTASRRTTRRRRGFWWTAVTAIAAAVLLVAVTGLRQIWQPAPAPEYAAVWGRGLNAVWQDSRSEGETPLPSPGDGILPGVYRLEQGIARLDFRGGAEVTCEAPATIELVDGQTGRLHDGRLVARMLRGRPAGFIIHTPMVDIVDRGTEFGVAVDSEGKTFVQVFEGHVDAQLTANEAGDTSISRRIWPLSALRVANDRSTPAREVPFEPRSFTRRCPELTPRQFEVATAPLVSLDHDPNATAHVKALAASLETAPASALQLGTIYEQFIELNDLTQSELNALVPALLQMLDDARPLAVAAGAGDSPARLRVADRADLVLQFIAGMSPPGEDRRQAWEQWWTSSREKPRTAWFADRQEDFRRALEGWRKGASYEECLYALKAVEIAARTSDQAVLPALMDVVSGEVSQAHETEVSLAAVLDCIGRLGTAELVPELIRLARPLNRDQLSAVPRGYSESHARRSDALRAFAAALDRLSGTRLADESLTTIGPPTYGMCALDEDVFDQWLQAAAQRAGDPVYRSPSDRTDAEGRSPASGG
jgi:hypothetical protein